MKYLDMARRAQAQREKERRFRRWKAQQTGIARVPLDPEVSVEGIGLYVVFEDHQSFGPFRPKSVRIDDVISMVFECDITQDGRAIAADVVWMGKIRRMKIPPAYVRRGDTLSVNYTAEERD